MKMSMSPPPPHASTIKQRTVSGTPIIPPTEKLIPSPEQLNKQPVPTPSKQPIPAKIGDDEHRRVSGEMQAVINGVASTPTPHGQN